ncbi:MAG: 4-oxalocrotonate tautomerase family protein [Candidatus Korobacteraceae bacterium]
MPFIQVKLIEGVFSHEQKQEMVRKLTDAMVSIEGENMRPVTSVVIEEIKSGEWAIGGNPLTTTDVMNLAAGKKVA